MSTGITIIGLGPGGSPYWTQAAQLALNQASEVYLRTAHHPGREDILPPTHAFDHLFKEADDFDPVYNQLAAAIVQLGQRPAGVVYAVPGHPVIDEPTVPRLRVLAQAQQLPVTLIPGLSLLDTARAALNLDNSCPLQIVTADEIARRHHPPLAPDQPALITHLYHPRLATRVKQTLLNAYAAQFMVTLVQANDAGQVQLCHLFELERQPHFNLQTMLYLPADPTNAGFTTFQETIAHLRAPEGCPWDREQTHQSLRPFLLEETCEALEALDANDPVGLAEELGDVLLQVVLHTQIATGLGEFKMGDVLEQINRKLLRRHPHVFGSVTVNGAGEVTINWEAIKKNEKAAKGQLSPTASALDGVPPTLPALAQALAISRKAVKAGFEWQNIEGVLDKLVEEAHEITTAATPAQLEAEIGDLLFCAVNLARWRNVDAETALRSTNARFTRRFKKMESLAAAQGKTLPDMSIEEKKGLWNEAKNYE